MSDPSVVELADLVVDYSVELRPGDLICGLRDEGGVYADGELVWKAGRFLREPQPAEPVAAS